MGRSIDGGWHGQISNAQQAQTPTVYLFFTILTDTLDPQA